uniref:Uncharacterized protein n=1 Tax=Plectus sambesii TaxID=2011161 RepID=A0A914WCS0_9BILA
MKRDSKEIFWLPPRSADRQIFTTIGRDARKKHGDSARKSRGERHDDACQIHTARPLRAVGDSRVRSSTPRGRTLTVLGISVTGRTVGPCGPAGGRKIRSAAGHPSTRPTTAAAAAVMAVRRRRSLLRPSTTIGRSI